MLIKRKIILFHFLFFLILSSGFLWPNFYYWSFLLFNLLFFIYIYQLKNIIFKKGLFSYLILPWLFINGLVLYLGLLINKFLVISFLFLGIILSFYYFKELKRRLTRVSDFNVGNFSTWTDVLSLFSVFLITSFSYGLVYFLNISNWALIIIITLVLFFSIWQNILIIELNKNKSLFFAILFLLAILPLAWSFFLLPFNYNILGLLLMVCYYFGLTFIKSYLSKDLSNKKIKYNLIFIITLLIIIFLMIKWQ